LLATQRTYNSEISRHARTLKIKMSIDKRNMTAGEKAAHTRKWRRAAEKAHESCQHAKTFTKYFLSKKGYKCLDLDSRQAGYEYKGGVDSS